MKTKILDVIYKNFGELIQNVYESSYCDNYERVPYLEIKAKVSNVKELLKLWDDVIDTLKQHFSQEDLEKISIFLTRESKQLKT